MHKKKNNARKKNSNHKIICVTTASFTADQLAIFLSRLIAFKKLSEKTFHNFPRTQEKLSILLVRVTFSSILNE